MAMDILLLGGDFDFRSPMADTKTSPALVMQQLEAVIRVSRGEHLMNRRDGFPWQIFGTAKRFQVESFRQELLRAISEIEELVTPEVTVEKSGGTVTTMIEVYHQPTATATGVQVIFSLNSTDTGDGIVSTFVPARRPR